MYLRKIDTMHFQKYFLILSGKLRILLLLSFHHQLMFCYIWLYSAILVPNNSFIMLTNILLFQHYFTKFVTYYSQNYASILGSGLASNVTGPVKINYVSAEKSPSLLYHNLRATCTNKINSLWLLQNLMGFLLKFTEMAYHIQNWRY